LQKNWQYDAENFISGVVQQLSGAHFYKLKANSEGREDPSSFFILQHCGLSIYVFLFMYLQSRPVSLILAVAADFVC